MRLSGRLPARIFDKALSAALACCTQPRRVLRAGGVATADRPWLAVSELEALGELANNPEEMEACEKLVAEVVANRDVWSCLRRLALADFAAAEAAGLPVGKNDARAQPVLELARALRVMLAHADVPDSCLRPHLPALLGQLFDLWAGDERLASAARRGAAAGTRR